MGTFRSAKLDLGDLPTRATTLAGMSFRALMAIAADFDLELDQMDAVNAFVNCPLEEEVVFMRMPPGFSKPGRILLLRKALYGLRRSPLLWQQHLTRSLEELGFEKVPQEPFIVFFYVDDIVWAYKKEDQGIAMEAMRGLQERYKMTLLGSPAEELLLLLAKQANRKFIDIAFAVSRLARHNQNPDETHQKAADRVILYLYNTRSFGIRLGGSIDKRADIFLCSSDSSFADNSLDRKSSQGYIMTLFGGSIAWRASKQATRLTRSYQRDYGMLISTGIGYAKRLKKEEFKSMKADGLTKALLVRNYRNSKR
ncbi:reverse transcriptase (RNA-dependent DNA polymerase) [Hirsutella rhossiliensis]